MSPVKSVWRRGIFVFLIIASLALLTVSFREAESGPVHDIRQAFGSLLSPLQEFGARVAEPFQDGYEWFKSVWSARKKSEQLEEQLDVLQGEVVLLEEQAEENERLKALLKLRDEGTYPTGTEFEVAQVIGKSPSQWEAWVRINKGSVDGLRVNQPVVGATPTVGETAVGKGLVGKIVTVDASTAVVQLITDTQSAVAGKIQGSRAEGIVHGSLQGRLLMDYVDRDLAVETKRVVVTSGYGELYPPDIPIGLVVSVGEETINMFKNIEVQPFVDFRVLEEVMILLVSENALPGGATTTTLAGSPTGAAQ